jgi:3-oxoacyl-[acyl-carrier-protein] synthase-1
MTAPALAVLSVGMVSGVGLTAPAAGAAIRGALDNFQETRFIDSGGEWIVGCSVPLEQPWRGRTKLLKMLALTLQDCVAKVRQLDLRRVPLLLGVAELDWPGRLAGLDDSLLADLQTETGLSFHPRSQVIAAGRVSGIEALRQARQLLEKENVSQVMIAGVDSLLVAATLKAYEEQEKLLTSQNSDGFLPGEAAAAILVGKPLSSAEPQLVCVGLGLGTEPAVEGSELPLRADGLVEAIRGALGEASCDLGAIDFRITDAAGGQYNFKEAALALTRLLRKRKEKFDIWHPADCIGEVGAAIVPVIITVAWFACRKGYADGPKILGHVGNDQGKRGALVLFYQ